MRSNYLVICKAGDLVMVCRIHSPATKERNSKMMKKVCVFVLVISLCIGLCACAGSLKPAVTTQAPKSLEAQRADAFILAIGEVTADSEATILAAQTYYDSLTEAQKAEVEHYELLVSAQAVLPQKKQEAQQKVLQEQYSQALAFIADKKYIQASEIIYKYPEFSDYDALVKECGEGVISEYIIQKSETFQDGYYAMVVEDTEELQKLALYYPDSKKILLSYYHTAFGSVDVMTLTFVPGSGEMTFERQALDGNGLINYQKGVISTNSYTGTYTGSVVDNVDEPLIIHGLTVTASQSRYDKQTKGFQLATMQHANEMLETMYAALVKAGYKGTIQDLGFPAYIAE